MTKPKFVMPDRCIRHLKAAPTKPCKLALKRLKREPGGCEWFVKSEDCNYCFWYYLYKSNREHSVTEIAALWNTSVNNVSIAEKSSYRKIIKKII